MNPKIMLGAIAPVFAQVAGDLRAPIGEVLKILMMFGFLSGVALIISGAMAIRRGETEGGKMSILAGAIIAGAPAIMYAFYKVFGLDGSTPLFK